MFEIYCNKDTRIVTLTTDEIIELHKILCTNFHLLPEMEPVSPPGVKNQTMLESAISRQLVGSGDYYKYSDPFSNCATLVYGLVKNHPFHNGNKRIGFLALLKHLYLNGYVIRANIKHDEIYVLLKDLANNSLVDHSKQYNQHFFKQNHHKISRNTHSSNWSDDFQIDYLSFWLKKNAEHKNTKIKQKTITISELERVLGTKDLLTEFSGKFLEIKKKASFFKEILGKQFKKQYIIKDSKNIPLNLVEQMRKDFGLSFLDGVDNSTFYNDEDILTNEIVSYKKIIYKLAKT